jgi:hypothetical protein
MLSSSACVIPAGLAAAAAVASSAAVADGSCASKWLTYCCVVGDVGAVKDGSAAVAGNCAPKLCCVVGEGAGLYDNIALTQLVQLQAAQVQTTALQQQQ